MMYIHRYNYVLPESCPDLPYLKLGKPNNMDLLEKNEMRRLAPIILHALGSALFTALKDKTEIAGIITGTGRGCLSKLEQFLNDMDSYHETALNPTVFIQATNNTIGGLIAQKLDTGAYNVTFVNQGLTVLNVLKDSQIISMENPEKMVLFGFFEENTDFNQMIHDQSSYLNSPDGSKIIYGEGTSFFLASQKREKALAKIDEFQLIPTTLNFEKPFTFEELHPNAEIKGCTAFYLGYNNLFEEKEYYHELIQFASQKNIAIIPFKKQTGDFDTSSSLALAMAIEKLATENIQTIYIFNHYKRLSLTMIKLSKPS
ncbi:MAG: hypothetical protein J5I59_01770 [Saprospiraceae bacterium]|nr:hypothetical protein [Saprospiraceae bacterium]